MMRFDAVDSLARVESFAERLGTPDALDALYEKAGFDPLDYHASLIRENYTPDQIRAAEENARYLLKEAVLKEAANPRERKSRRSWLPKAVLAGALAASVLISGCTGGPSPQQSVQTQPAGAAAPGSTVSEDQLWEKLSENPAVWNDLNALLGPDYYATATASKLTEKLKTFDDYVLEAAQEIAKGAGVPMIGTLPIKIPETAAQFVGFLKFSQFADQFRDIQYQCSGKMVTPKDTGLPTFIGDAGTFGASGTSSDGAFKIFAKRLPSLTAGELSQAKDALGCYKEVLSKKGSDVNALYLNWLADNAVKLVDAKLKKAAGSSITGQVIGGPSPAPAPQTSAPTPAATPAPTKRVSRGSITVDGDKSDWDALGIMPLITGQNTDVGYWSDKDWAELKSLSIAAIGNDLYALMEFYGDVRDNAGLGRWIQIGGSAIGSRGEGGDHNGLEFGLYMGNWVAKVCKYHLDAPTCTGDPITNVDGVVSGHVIEMKVPGGYAIAKQYGKKLATQNFAVNGESPFVTTFGDTFEELLKLSNAIL